MCLFQKKKKKQATEVKSLHVKLQMRLHTDKPKFNQKKKRTVIQIQGVMSDSKNLSILYNSFAIKTQHIINSTAFISLQVYNDNFEYQT